MIKIGLTGSIGMGKTTTAQMFRDEGCPVFDADAAVHALYKEGGQAVPIIRAVFPDAVRDGAVDRSVLGRYMREDALQLEVLESFIHPLVSESREAFFNDNKDSSFVVLDVPLLFEAGLDKDVDYIVVVTAPKEIQRERVLAREGMSLALFESLLARQMRDEEKRHRADALVFTDKGLENARKQVQKILRELRSAA